MTLGDSHWPVTVETKGHSKASGGHCGIGTGSSPRIFVFVSVSFRQYFIIIHSSVNSGMLV